MTAQQDAARTIWGRLKAAGFKDGPIAAILGNAQAESGIIANRWEGDNPNRTWGGFGLLQWTPSTKLTSWAHDQGLPPADLDTQIRRIIWEVNTNTQFAKPGTTFAQWVKTDMDPKKAADDFVRYYERPAVVNSTVRQNFAQAWYDQLRGTVAAPAPTPSKNKDGSTRLVLDGNPGVATWARAHEVFGIKDSKGRYPSTQTAALLKARQSFLNKHVSAKSIKDLTGKASLKVDGKDGPATTKVEQFYLFNRYSQAVLHRAAALADFDGVRGHNTNVLFQYALNQATTGKKAY